jgi:hypothetical protein
MIQSRKGVFHRSTLALNRAHLNVRTVRIKVATAGEFAAGALRLRGPN